MTRIAGMPAVAPILNDAFVAAFRAGTLTAGQVEAALPRDRAAAIFFLLQLSTALGSPAPAGGAHTPPGTVPPYAKPAATPRRKKRGAVTGHTGAARPRPVGPGAAGDAAAHRPRQRPRPARVRGGRGGGDCRGVGR